MLRFFFDFDLIPESYVEEGIDGSPLVHYCLSAETPIDGREAGSS